LSDKISRSRISRRKMLRNAAKVTAASIVLSSLKRDLNACELIGADRAIPSALDEPDRVAALLTGFERQTASFQSPDLILVGDTQRTGFWERVARREQNDAVREAIMREIAAENPKLVVLLGDLVANGGDEDAWRYFDRFTEPVRQKKIPMWPLLGNHEYNGDHAAMRKAVFSRFPELGEKTWAVVRGEGIAILLLNSNFGNLTADEIREQNDWYLDRLAALGKDPAVQFIIVGAHHPPYTNSAVVSPSSDVDRYLIPPYLTAGKAILFASGHCHSYEHFRHEEKELVVTGGGGGPRQKLKTPLRKRRFKDVYDGPALRPFNFCRVTREGSRLRITTVCPDESLQRFKVYDQFLTSSPAEKAER
jgi:hypothetical protein